MSGSVLDELAEPLRNAVVAAGGDGGPVQLDRPSDPSLGDYASAVALSLAKPLSAPPRAIAERIVAGLESPWIDTAEIAGPGFINLRVRPSWFGHVVGRVLDEGAGYGGGATPHPQRLQVEFVSGNPTGPMTVATARNAAYGDALGRLFDFAGHSVEREYYFNDTGRQIELFGASLLARARGEEPPEDGYQGEYVAEIATTLGLSTRMRRSSEWARARHRRDDGPRPGHPGALSGQLRLVVPRALAARGRHGGAGDREGSRRPATCTSGTVPSG